MRACVRVLGTEPAVLRPVGSSQNGSWSGAVAAAGCKFDKARGQLFWLGRSSGVLGGVHLVGTDLSNGAVTTDNKLPFFGRTAEAFAEGLDYYLDGTATGPERRLVVTGPDTIDFIHVLTVEPQPKVPGFDDLLQYGGGLKLVRGGSAFDSVRDEVWLQVVYDTSKSGAAGPGTQSVVPGTYLKRYGIRSAGLENTVEDPFATTALEYDPLTKVLYGVGVCKGNGTADAGVRCLVRCDPSMQFPKMTSVAEIRGVGQLIGGVSALVKGDSSSVMYTVANVGDAPPLSYRKLFRCIGGETGVCTRSADADTGTAGPNKWALVGISLADGSVTSNRPLGWASRLEPLPPLALSA